MFPSLPSVEDVVTKALDALGGARFHTSPDVRHDRVDRLYRHGKRDQWNLDDRRDRYFSVKIDELARTMAERLTALYGSLIPS